MSVTRKERLRRALAQEPVDRLPTQLSCTGAMARKLATHLGVTVAELPARVDNHMLRVDLSYPDRLNSDGSIRYDWWSVGWSTREEGYLPAECPLAGDENLDDFPWPDPDAPLLLDEAARIIAADKGERFIAPNFGFALFERAWTLRGFEQLLVDTALNPTFVADLLERITAIQLRLVNRFIDLGVDGGYFGDDYGAQKGMLFSPVVWRELIKPRLARLFAPFRERGLPLIMHSDGQIGPILPDLIEIGLTTLNPVQPEVLDHGWLKQTYGNSLTFYGGISTQTVLPFGTPAEVRQAVRQCVTALAAGGTGLLLGPSHRMMADIPLENVDAMLDEFDRMRNRL